MKNKKHNTEFLKKKSDNLVVVDIKITYHKIQDSSHHFSDTEIKDNFNIIGK